MEISNCTTPRHFVTYFADLDGEVSTEESYTILDQMKEHLSMHEMASLQFMPTTPSNVSCSISEMMGEMGY